jgi:hypothetical protein
MWFHSGVKLANCGRNQFMPDASYHVSTHIQPICLLPYVNQLWGEPIFSKCVTPRVYAHSVNLFITPINPGQNQFLPHASHHVSTHIQPITLSVPVLYVNYRRTESAFNRCIIPCHSQPIRLFYANQIRTEPFLLMRQRAKHVSTHFIDQLP